MARCHFAISASSHCSLPRLTKTAVSLSTCSKNFSLQRVFTAVSVHKLAACQSPQTCLGPHSVTSNATTCCQIAKCTEQFRRQCQAHLHSGAHSFGTRSSFQTMNSTVGTSLHTQLWSPADLEVLACRNACPRVLYWQLPVSREAHLLIKCPWCASTMRVFWGSARPGQAWPGQVVDSCFNTDRQGTPNGQRSKAI